MRHAARTDANHNEVCKALRSVGVSVEYIKLPMDLLICFRERTALAEIKVGDEGLTKNQVEFIARWPGKIFVFRSPEDAINQIVEWGKP